MSIDVKPNIIKLDMKKIAKMNIWFTFGLSVLFLIANSLIHQQFSVSISLWNILLFIVCYIALIGLHEIFHLFGFMLFGKVKFNQLDYGVNLKLGIAYATTTQPLTNTAMKKALLLPFWTTGVIPSILGFLFQSNLLVLLGAFLIAGAVGDFYMYKELRKFPNTSLVKDDPELPQLYVYEEGIEVSYDQ
ncbi:DUF3267 domain-containing protein [Ureibacillus chungkukjangi]|uniref:Putative zincin peptidase n=1 Tax=Ureibacillus chungkukjangi TaxID=1202712 RepID=A0A318TVH1_9BACL|nr:DUF3267 domain-containing protein [Ureibacillus chungkukjangi]MCM3387571.1 DUF3267 domain-containing protein [Ureibacillus chungkukjangi]PYF07847.1 putative zincin peptidase [Ureibacillus chungkukjangi]